MAALCFMGACTLNGQKTATTGNDRVSFARLNEGKYVRELDGETARGMHNRFPDAKVKKNQPFFVEFEREQLIQILSESSGATVKFLVGAYAEGEGGDKASRPTIILQTGVSSASSGKASTRFALYRYFEASTLCPPPTLCKLEN